MLDSGGRTEWQKHTRDLKLVRLGFMGEGGHENNGAIFRPVDLAVDFFKSNGLLSTLC